MRMKRKKGDKRLDAFACPARDVPEYCKAVAAIEQLYPDVELGYVGTDGKHHFFQKWGDPVAYVVPVSEGWTLPEYPEPEHIPVTYVGGVGP